MLLNLVNKICRSPLQHLLLLPILMLFVANGQAAAQQVSDEQAGWKADISLYYWLLATEGTLTVDGLTAEYDLSENEMAGFTDEIEEVFMGMVNFRKGPYLIYLNSAYVHYDDMDLESAKVGPVDADFDVQWQQLVAEVGVGYRVFDWYGQGAREPDLGIDLLVGGRYVYIDTDIEVTKFPVTSLVGFKAKSSESWVEPWLGLRVQVDLTEKWTIYGQGSVGGFGVDNVPSTSVDIIGVMQYRITPHWAANLAYRHLELSYEKGQVVNLAGQLKNAFAHDSTLSGPILGLTYIF